MIFLFPPSGVRPSDRAVQVSGTESESESGEAHRSLRKGIGVSYRGTRTPEPKWGCLYLRERLLVGVKGHQKDKP